MEMEKRVLLTLSFIISLNPFASIIFTSELLGKRPALTNVGMTSSRNKATNPSRRTAKKDIAIRLE